MVCIRALRRTCFGAYEMMTSMALEATGLVLVFDLLDYVTFSSGLLQPYRRHLEEHRK